MSRLETVLREHFGAAYMTALEADRRDAALMIELAELRVHEDQIDDELRDPESAVCQGYAVIAGERSYPTAKFLVDRDCVVDTRPPLPIRVALSTY